MDDEVSKAALDIAGERSAERVLERVAGAACSLTHAAYGAVGVPDGHGGFSRFVTAGIDDDEAAAIGPLPRTHGLLGALLDATEPYRVADVRRDPRFEGWPAPHPEMGPFLGVPVAGDGDTTGAIYVTRDAGEPAFTGADQSRLEVLAAHAAVAMDNARLWERSRELVLAEERERLARDLHDTMTQRLFSLRLTAQTAAGLVTEAPEAASAHLTTITELASESLAELRTLLVDLSPAEVSRHGLGPALRSHAELLRRAHHVPIRLEVSLEVEPTQRTQREVLRMAQEALANAVRHADARHLTVLLGSDATGVRLTVSDDGRGFDPSDPALRATRLGLTSMRHRARALGGRLRIDSTAGTGTTVSLEAPLG